MEPVTPRALPEIITTICVVPEGIFVFENTVDIVSAVVIKLGIASYPDGDTPSASVNVPA